MYFSLLKQIHLRVFEETSMSEGPEFSPPRCEFDLNG